MSENTMPPLDLDLNTVDTSFPLIMNGELVGISIDKVENVLTAKQSNMLKLTLKTTTSTKSIKNEVLNPGLTLFHNINLEPTGKGTWEMVVRNIASVTQPTGWQGNLQAFLNGGFMTLQGARCNAKVSYVPEGPDKTGTHRNAKNEIAAFLKP